MPGQVVQTQSGVQGKPPGPAPQGSFWRFNPGGPGAPGSGVWQLVQGEARGNVLEEAGEGIKEAAGVVGDALGLSAPDTRQLSTDTESLRQLRGQFAQELAAQGPRDVPQVTAAQAQGVNLGDAALSARLPTVDAPTLGPTERAEAARAMAAPVSRVGPTTAAQAFGVGPATAGQMRAAEIQTGPQDQARAVQGEAIQATRDALSGKAPSVAELQMREQLNRNVGAIQSRAAGARGLGAGAVRRQAAREMARAEADAMSQGALLRANEVATARGQLGGLATDTRGQDLSLATNQAGLVQGERQFNAGEAGTTSRFNVGQGNQLAATNAGFQQQATQSDADRAQGANLAEAQLGTNVNLANANNQTGVSTFNAGQTNTRQVQQGQMQLEADTGNVTRQQQNQQFNAGAINTRTGEQGQLTQQNNQFNTGQTNTANTGNANRTLEGRQIDDTQRSGLRSDTASAARDVVNAEQGRLNTEEAAKGRRTELVSNVAKSGATALAASDEDLKKRIKPDPKAAEEFLREVKPISFEFKSSAVGKAPAAGPGRQLGVRAQDVEGTDLGDDFVVDGPGGKALDQGNAIGPILAALVHMNKKLEAVTKQRRAAARELR
jgi:hypothetical protein